MPRSAPARSPAWRRRTTRSTFSTSMRTSSIRSCGRRSGAIITTLSRNQVRLADYIARLRAADALIVQFPVWSFGMPAMLKGYFDRIMMPGVAFDLSDPARSRPLLGNLRRIAGIATYGRPRIRALAVGDPPRKMVKRYLPWFANWRARVDYYALYHMNVATDADRAAFIDKVEREMSRF